MATKEFSPWLSAPSATNKKWINTAYGGYNKCVIINDATGSCLANCVGWAWGRWVGLVGKNHRLSRSNAEDWFVNTADGYQRGQAPKLGAVICWRGGRVGDNRDGRGHVGIVEKIYSDKSVLCSMSDYGGARFYTMKLKPPYYLSGLNFQGFIYTPTTYIEKKAEAKKKEVTCTGVATHYSAALAGTYKTTAALHCRDAAGTNHASLVVIPKGTKVRCYGYYSIAGGVKWPCIQFTLNGTTYTGFSSADYLTKIS